MSSTTLRVRRPSAAEITRILSRATESSPTYSEIGATRDELPTGYRHDRYEAQLGDGEHVFDRAVAALRAWQAHIGAGAQVFPQGEPVEDRGTVVLVIRVGGPWATLPCRVVYVDEGPDEFAFVYGTLPGHAEKGESALSAIVDASR